MSALKKVLLWILILGLAFTISFYYHKSLNEGVSNDVEKSFSDESVLVSGETDNKVEISGNAVEVVDDKSGQDENDNSKDSEVSGEVSEPYIPDTKIETLSGSYSNLSNKTNAWGFVRKSNGVQPELYGPYTNVLDDYNGIYMGNSEEQVIYLTFDEGYENGYTASILDTLKEKDVTAIFFVTMPYVKQNPELIKRMIEEGHFVGNHTVNHPSMPEVTDDEKLAKEITELHDYILQNYNYEMKYLRPPKGEYSERTVKLSLDLGYQTVLWSSAYDDWDRNNQKGADYAKKMIYNNLHNGCVMLLHAVSKDNAEVLGDAIDEIRNRGYEFRTLDEFER